MTVARRAICSPSHRSSYDLRLTTYALADHARYGREGIAPRAPGEIGIHSIRAGAAAGEHRIILASEGEQIEVLHRAVSRQTYAAGALRAAQWLAEQPPGLYGMSAVL